MTEFQRNMKQLKKKLEYVDITKVPCWRCLHFQGNWILGFRCPKNKVIPKRLPKNFAEKCKWKNDTYKQIAEGKLT